MLKTKNTNTKIKKNVTFSTQVFFFFLNFKLNDMLYVLCIDFCNRIYSKGGKKAGKNVKSVLSTVNLSFFFLLSALSHIFHGCYRDDLSSHSKGYIKHFLVMLFFLLVLGISDWSSFHFSISLCQPSSTWVFTAFTHI